MAFAGIKTLIQKKLDRDKWNLGPITPGGIRLLTDSGGNLIGIITVGVNPQDAAPLAPGSTEAASVIDPFAFIGDNGGAQLGYSGTKKNGKVVVIGINVQSSTDTYVTLHDEEGNDYQVPTGKVFSCVQANLMEALLDGVGLGYGDTGVALGTSAPTNHVQFPWTNHGDTQTGMLVVTTVSVKETINIGGEIPAGKYPVAHFGAASNIVSLMLVGIEHDA